MKPIHSVFSPVFPVEKDADVSEDALPLAHTTTVQVFIRLAEPVVYVQGFESKHKSERPTSLLRGSLILRILKPSKLKSISLTFQGHCQTEWPEGIPPKRQEFVSVNDIVNHTWPFYQAEHTETIIDNELNSKLDTLSSEYNGYVLKKTGASIFKPSSSSVYSNREASMSTNSVTLGNLKINHRASEPENIVNRNRTRTNSSVGLKVFNRSKSIDNHLHPSTQSPPKSLFAGFLSNAFSSSIEPTSIDNQLHKDSSNLVLNNHSHSFLNSSGYDAFIFEPGEYIYAFEQPIPSSYPETIKANYGHVEYSLTCNIERFGTFKTNVTAKLPVTLVRTQSMTSVEESEPITVSRNWENLLHYDIVIASKDIILDAFLPLSFHLSPMDKIKLHRIRIFLTEAVDYYCENDKIHRTGMPKKYLLAEYNGPVLPEKSGKKKVKAKHLGNLLEDPVNGDLINKNFEFEVYVPSKFNNEDHLHPDTGFKTIRAKHWIKLCLRLSRVIDGEPKHYEVNIDSPIHVLNKLCSHANTLLPSYESYIHANRRNSSCAPMDDNDNKEELCHNSNFFFPKEIIMSPVLAPADVHSKDLTIPNISKKVSTGNGNTAKSSNSKDAAIFTSPRLKFNIYRPESLQRELIAPQALPLSPVTSPTTKPLHDSNDTPPPFDFSTDSPISDLPGCPPTYNEVLELDGVERTKVRTSASHIIPKITLNNSTDQLLDPKTQFIPVKYNKNYSVLDPKRVINLEDILHSCDLIDEDEDEDDEDDGDIASAFSFQSSPGGSPTRSPNLPSAVLKTQSPVLQSLNLNLDIRSSRRGSDILPSTVRYSNGSLSEMNEVLTGRNGNNSQKLFSRNIATIDNVLPTDDMQPDVSSNEIPCDSTVDLTTLLKHDESGSRHTPLFQGVNYTSNNDQVMNDFKQVFKDDNVNFRRGSVTE